MSRYGPYRNRLGELMRGWLGNENYQRWSATAPSPGLNDAQHISQQTAQAIQRQQAEENVRRLAATPPDRATLWQHLKQTVSRNAVRMPSATLDNDGFFARETEVPPPHPPSALSTEQIEELAALIQATITHDNDAYGYPEDSEHQNQYDYAAAIQRTLAAHRAEAERVNRDDLGDDLGEQLREEQEVESDIMEAQRPRLSVATSLDWDRLRVAIASAGLSAENAALAMGHLRMTVLDSLQNFTSGSGTTLGVDAEAVDNEPEESTDDHPTVQTVGTVGGRKVT